MILGLEPISFYFFYSGIISYEIFMVFCLHYKLAKIKKMYTISITLQNHYKRKSLSQ